MPPINILGISFVKIYSFDLNNIFHRFHPFKLFKVFLDCFNLKTKQSYFPRCGKHGKTDIISLIIWQMVYPNLHGVCTKGFDSPPQHLLFFYLTL